MVEDRDHQIAAAAASPTVPEETKEAPSQDAVATGTSQEVEMNYGDEEDSVDINTKEPMIASFKDHFTLLIPSSTIRYREKNAAARVLETSDAQFVLEETYDEDTKMNQVSIRRIHDTSEGVRFLRISYAIVTAFWTGFLFVFCLQVLLFLFLDLAIQSGATTKQGANWGKALGAILAFPGFVYGLSSALVIAGCFILDTWRGHFLIRNFTFKRMKRAAVEWIFFAFFLGLPLLVLCCTLLARLDTFWAITLLFWFACVALFYTIFAVNIIWYEMKACWEVTKNKNKKDNDSWFNLMRLSILSRQIHSYSGRSTHSYLALGSIRDSEYTDSKSRRNMIGSTAKEYMSLPAKWTTWRKWQRWGLYENVQAKQERIYSIDDARDVRPYLTSHTWGLEKIFCRPRNSRYIAIVRGPGALTRSQLRSSIICSFLGSFLLFLICLSVLIFLKVGAAFTGFMVAVAFLVFGPSFLKTTKLIKTIKTLEVGHSEMNEKMLDEESNMRGEIDAGYDLVDRRTSAHESACVYLVEEVYRVTRPTHRFCWIMFGLEVSLFFIYPLIALFAVGNYPLGIMFIVFAGISYLRYYINAAIVLEECGRMDLVDGANEFERWKAESRLNEIVGNVTRGRSLKAWMSVLGSIGFIFLALMVGAVGSDQEQEAATTETTGRAFAPSSEFEYKQQDSLRYPTCTLSSDLGASPLTSMADFAFLAGLAYRDVGVTQTDLNGWFGEGVAIDQQQEVDSFRNRTGTPSAVSFKLVTFPFDVNDPEGDAFAQVLIRGTTSPWDMLTDAQLWSAAALLQVLRELLPFGIMWTAVIDELIMAITKIESEGIESVSFYKDTTEFVNYVKQQPQYKGVGITGHSLGGGLSIITGAQTGTPAVALSGPNAKLSRKTFDPPISNEDLDSKTFNIIPARDLVPMIDDVAQNWQGIRCKADFQDVIGCHNSIRSLCEIIFSCGTRLSDRNGTEVRRPIPCVCVTQFKYQVPNAIDGRNATDATEAFKEACNIQE